MKVRQLEKQPGGQEIVAPYEMDDTDIQVVRKLWSLMRLMILTQKNHRFPHVQDHQPAVGENTRPQSLNVEEFHREVKRARSISR